ncbi:MAG TPA: 16S rRNA pseudouridine(516) synthase [Candidatus Paceibacterota bacterium]|nr:16S rRNA pseudouridine(516) synthase [Candidatus Paceibacterota bacterium]
MLLRDVLFSQGFGTRRICTGLVEQGLVALDGRVETDPFRDVPTQVLQFRVHGENWSYQERAYLMMHKPIGTECSQRPSAWPSVYTLLPAPLRQRPRKGAAPGVQAIGRLDQDTTGLLLLSDDGAFIHRMSSPRGHVPKVYEAVTVDAVSRAQIDRLLEGVVLADDPKPVRALACEPAGTHGLRLTLSEGKYHQVKRMIAAVGNRVERLHRSRIGGLALPSDLLPGRWRWMSGAELDALSCGDPLTQAPPGTS